jgi:hypothetical protein
MVSELTVELLPLLGDPLDSFAEVCTDCSVLFAIGCNVARPIEPIASLELANALDPAFVALAQFRVECVLRGAGEPQVAPGVVQSVAVNVVYPLIWPGVH